MSALTIEGLELKLDTAAAEALRRAANRLDAEHASAEERARGMATARAVVKAWRERATSAALRSAVSGGAGR